MGKAVVSKGTFLPWEKSAPRVRMADVLTRGLSGFPETAAHGRGDEEEETLSTG